MTHSMDMAIHPGTILSIILHLDGEAATECTLLTVGGGGLGIRPITIALMLMEDSTEVITDGEAVITTPTTEVIMEVITEITVIMAKIQETTTMEEGLQAPTITEVPTIQLQGEVLHLRITA